MSSTPKDAPGEDPREETRSRQTLPDRRPERRETTKATKPPVVSTAVVDDSTVKAPLAVRDVNRSRSGLYAYPIPSPEELAADQPSLETLRRVQRGLRRLPESTRSNEPPQTP